MPRMLTRLKKHLLSRVRPEVPAAAPGSGPRQLLCVGHDAGFYGAQLLLLHIVRLLKREFGFEVTVVLMGDGPLRAEFESLGRVIDFTKPGWRETWSWREQWRRRRVLAELAQQGCTHALCNTTISGRLLPMLKAHGFRTLALVHELPQLLREFGLQDAAAAVGRLADRSIFPAEFVRDRFAETVELNLTRALVRPQGLYRTNPYRGQRSAMRTEVLQLLALPRDAQLVVAAGSADRRKGVDIFVKVAAEVSREQHMIHFVWIGQDGTEMASEMRAWAKSEGVDSNLHFLGLITDPDVYSRRIAGADLYLLTSREDPFPSVVLEAMTVGMPVVGFSGAGGFDTLLLDGAGVLVPLEDHQAMADAVCRVLSPGGAAAAMGAAGQRIIDTRFGFSNYVRDLLGLLDLPLPSVSVVVPNYNYARHLPERLATIFAQTYRPLEIIFLDDCSTDDSVAVATALLADSGLPHRIVTNERNAGCYAQWLKGIALAQGELVWIAEADDSCDADLLATLVTGMADPQVSLAYCQSRKVDGNGQLIRADYLDYTDSISRSKWLAPYQRDGIDEIRDTLAIKNTIPNASAVLMRKSALQGLAEKLQGLHNAGDWLTYVHVLESGQVWFTPRALNRHRLHQRSITKGGNAERHFAEILQVQARIAARHPLPASTVAQVEAMRQFTFQYLALNSAEHPVYSAHPVVRQAVTP